MGVSTKRFVRILASTSVATLGAGSVFLATRHYDPPVYSKPPQTDEDGELRLPTFPKIRSRHEQLTALKASSRHKDEVYDILIIGGGATGTGIAVDAATRGLKVALVEAEDFASGTSSKSTKLVHGGVRYLEKAVWELDYGQYKLVREALRERASFLEVAPHLASWMPIMIPMTKWWQVPYFWAGIKCYDLLAGSAKSSYYMTKAQTLEAFPTINSADLVGSLVYYDGSHNDSRTNVSLATTAASYGATVVNYLEITSLSTGKNGRLDGARVRDRLPSSNGEESEFNIKAKGVINATGPFTDDIRKMADEEVEKIVSPSSGVHIVLPGHLGPANLGLLDPATSDGRVVFFLPWLGHIVAGTTDVACSVTRDPMATEEEIEWILKEVKHYLRPGIEVRRSDVLAAWSGIRPLVRDPAKARSEGLVRNHLLTTSSTGLITMAGGKWTTYRQMAEETVDEAIKEFQLSSSVNKTKLLPYISGAAELEQSIRPDGTSKTLGLKLVGAHGWSPTLYIEIIQKYGLDADVAQHLTSAYGDRAWQVAELCRENEALASGKRLCPSLPFVDGEVLHAVRSEYAQTAVDVMSRRMRLAFLNVKASLDALPRVIDIMARELGWDHSRQNLEYERAIKYLGTMGLASAGLDDITRHVEVNAVKVDIDSVNVSPELLTDGVDAFDGTTRRPIL